MAAVKCPKCKAVVSVRCINNAFESGCGADMRAKCTALDNDLLDLSAACPQMSRAIRRASFRIRAEALQG